VLPASDPEPPVAATADGPTFSERATALLEVLLCSDYPTQFALAATFAAFGYGPLGPDGHLRVGYVVTLSFLDTALLLGLILVFLRTHGEQPREVFFGSRSVAREAAAGVPLTFVSLAIGIGMLALIKHFMPSLHTVEQNPLQELIRTPQDAWTFALVVVVAGGVREESADAAIATGALGAFWGVVYLRRRSIAAPIVSHSGFNLLQILQFTFGH
jgi:membrane protease YdiL (CAAX protease family)